MKIWKPVYTTGARKGVLILLACGLLMASLCACQAEIPKEALKETAEGIELPTTLQGNLEQKQQQPGPEKQTSELDPKARANESHSETPPPLQSPADTRSTPALTRFEGQIFGAFDTVTQIIAYCPSEADFKGIFARCEALLMDYHHRFNRYPKAADQRTSEVAQINQRGQRSTLKLSTDLARCLDLALRIARSSRGHYNPFAGKLLTLWHQAREEASPQGIGEPPSEALIAEALRHQDLRQVHLDLQTSTLTLDDPQMELDLGSIAKGYAVEAVLQKLAQEYPGLNLICSAGGNVRAIGWRGQNGHPWRVGIRNPLNDGLQAESYALHDLSLVTSGNYERFFLDKAGHRYAHIIDAENGRPAERWAQVSILGPDSGIADALSTSLFILSEEEGRALLEDYPDYAALWVLHSGELRSTDNWPWPDRQSAHAHTAQIPQIPPKEE